MRNLNRVEYFKGENFRHMILLSSFEYIFCQCVISGYIISSHPYFIDACKFKGTSSQMNMTNLKYTSINIIIIGHVYMLNGSALLVHLTLYLFRDLNSLI